MPAFILNSGKSLINFRCQLLIHRTHHSQNIDYHSENSEVLLEKWGILLEIRVATSGSIKVVDRFWLVENVCGWFQMSQLLPSPTKSWSLKFVGNDQHLRSVQEFQQFWASPWREELPGCLFTHATHLGIILSLHILHCTTNNFMIVFDQFFI